MLIFVKGLTIYLNMMLIVMSCMHCVLQAGPTVLIGSMYGPWTSCTSTSPSCISIQLHCLVPVYNIGSSTTFGETAMNEKQSWHLDDCDFQALPTFMKEAQTRNEPEWERACDLVVMHLKFPFLY
jgi:hypothetical protein